MASRRSRRGDSSQLPDAGQYRARLRPVPVVRRGDDVRQVKKRLIDAELAVAYRFNPPGIDAGGKARVLEQVIIQRPFLHDLAAGQVDENGILFHAAKLGGPDQAASRPG